MSKFCCICLQTISAQVGRHSVSRHSPPPYSSEAEASKGLVSDAQRLDPSTMEVSLTPGERAHIVLKFFSTCCGHPLSLPPEQRGTAVSLCEGNVDEYLPEGVGGAVSLQPEHGVDRELRKVLLLVVNQLR